MPTTSRGLSFKVGPFVHAPEDGSGIIARPFRQIAFEPGNVRRDGQTDLRCAEFRLAATGGEPCGASPRPCRHGAARCVELAQPIPTRNVVQLDVRCGFAPPTDPMRVELVRKGGLEPPRVAPLAPKASASTGSATFALAAGAQYIARSIGDFGADVPISPHEFAGHGHAPNRRGRLPGTHLDCLRPSCPGASSPAGRSQGPERE